MENSLNPRDDLCPADLPKALFDEGSDVRSLFDPNRRQANDPRREALYRALEEQLRQAQKMDAVGQLAGGVAHDFNNLLTAIFGHLSTLREALHTDDPNRARVLAAEQAAARAGALSNQLLGLSRRTVLNPQSADLNQSIEEIVALLHRTIDPRIEWGQARSGFVAGPGPFRTSASGTDESVPQCPRRHARWRSAIARDEQCYVRL